MPVTAPKDDSIFYINADGHDPQALLDYAISLQNYLRSGEVVTSVSWVAYEANGTSTTNPPFTVNGATSGSPQAATITEAGTTYNDCEIVWLTVTGADDTAKNARAGETGIITMAIATNQSRTDHRSFKLHVAHR